MSAPSSRTPSASSLAAIALILVFLAAALPSIFHGGSNSRGASDQNTWHLTTIRQFAVQWPHPNLRDYPSATTPGYHLALAAAARLYGSTNERVLRLTGMFFTIALLATLAIAAGRQTGSALAAIAICLPVLASPYVFSSGVWLLPDNAGWLFVLLVMLLARRKQIDAKFHIGLAIAACALVWVRQSHAWVIAPILMAAWAGSVRGISQRSESPSPGAGAGRVALATLALLPAIASLIFFGRLWHGSVPPNQQNLVTGGNPAIPAAILSVIGVVGTFFAGFIPRPLISRRGMLIAAIGAIAGATIALLPRTTYDLGAGRFSGIWNLVPHFPILFGRSSLLIVALAIAGGMLTALWLSAMSARQRCIWTAALVAFVIVQSWNHNAFFRYYEPAVLMAAVLIVSSVSPRPTRWAYSGPVLLAVILAMVTFLQSA